MTKHILNKRWLCRTKKSSRFNAYVSLTYKNIMMICTDKNEHGTSCIFVDKLTARLLAKRINQCLDETK